MTKFYILSKAGECVDSVDADGEDGAASVYVRGSDSVLSNFRVSDKLTWHGQDGFEYAYDVNLKHLYRSLGIGSDGYKKWRLLDAK